MQQSLKKLMGGGGESLLVEVSKGYDIAIRRRWQILIVGQPPLLSGSSRAKKTTANEALQALGGDVRATRWLHWKMGVGGCELDGG